jgi:predicted nucleic acid-binding protein
MIVVDVTVLMPLLTRTEKFPAAVRVSDRDPVWVVPTVWRLEMLSALCIDVRAGNRSAEEARILLLAADMLVRESHETITDRSIFALATQTRLDAAQAVYVLTARRLGTVLVTADKQLLASCLDVAVSIDTFGTD